MTQIHRALAHYWNLRDQGVSPDAARDHVRSRFGVLLDSDPLARTAVSEPEPLGTDFTCTLPLGTDFTCTLVECGTDGRQGP